MRGEECKSAAHKSDGNMRARVFGSANQRANEQTGEDDPKKDKRAVNQKTVLCATPTSAPGA